MAKAKRPSLGRISKTLQQVRRDIARQKTHPEHRHVQKAALNFLDGVDSTLKAFCLQLDGDCTFECVPPPGGAAAAPRRAAGARKKR